MAAITPAAAMIRPTPAQTSRAAGGLVARPAGRSAMSASRSARTREAGTAGRPLVVFGFGQAALLQRGAEDADHLVAGDGVGWMQELSAFAARGHYRCRRECRALTSMYAPSAQKMTYMTAVRKIPSASVVFGPPGVSRNPAMPGRNTAYSIRQAIFVARQGSRGRLDRGLDGDVGGDLGGDLGQFRVRPRRVHPVGPRAELILGQPAVHERGLEGPDHLLAVGVRRAEAAAARHGAAVSSPGPAITAPPQPARCTEA